MLSSVSLPYFSSVEAPSRVASVRLEVADQVDGKTWRPVANERTVLRFAGRYQLIGPRLSSEASWSQGRVHTLTGKPWP